VTTPNPGQDQSKAHAVAEVARRLDPSLPLTLAKKFPDVDVYQRGDDPDDVLLVPALWSGMPDSLLATMRARRSCSATGRCPVCDATVDLAEKAVDHEPGCAVADEKVQPVLERWTRQVGMFARGRRITEDPA
jgi:hypothetical protein